MSNVNPTTDTRTLFTSTQDISKSAREEIIKSVRKLENNGEPLYYHDLGEYRTTVALYIENEMRANESKLESISRLDSRMLAMENTLKTIQDLAQNSMNNALHGRVENIDESLINLQNLLNSRHEGSALFAGTRTDIAPVQDLTKASNIIGGEYTANYYQGDDTKLSSFMKENFEVTYGITANMSPFRKLIGGLNHLKLANEAIRDETSIGVNNGDLDKGKQLIREAQSELNSMVNELGNKSKSIESQRHLFKTSQLNLEESKRKIQQDEMADVISKLTRQKTAVELSYSLIKMVNELSLNKYL